MRPRLMWAAAMLLAAGSVFAQEAIPLQIDKPVVREISGLEAHVYSVEIEQWQCATVALGYAGIDFKASLLAPGGETLVYFDVPQRGGDRETNDFVAAAAGVYRIRIEAPYRGYTGRYEIRLIGIRPASEHDRRLQEAMALGTEAKRLEQAGEYVRALSVAARAADLFEHELGRKDTRVGFWLSFLGYLHSMTGEYDQAEPLLREALEIQEKGRGPDHPDSLVTARWLGGVYRNAGEYSKAEPLLTRALERTEKIAGPDHPAVANCLMDLGMLHDARGDWVKEEAEFQRALAIVERALGPRDLKAAQLLNNLAVVYNAKQEYSRAEPLLERAIGIAQAEHGGKGIELALPLWNLALTAQEWHKDYPRALELYGRALALAEEARGPEHPNVAAILNNTANVYKSLGDYAKALELHRRVLAMWEKSLGPYHGRTVLALGNLARTYASMGDVENTIKWQTTADEALEKNLALNLAAGSERQKLAYFDSVSERTDRTISYHVKLAPESQAAARLAALAELQRKGRVLDAMALNLASLRQRLDAEGQALLDAWNTATGQFARLSLSGPGVLSRAAYQKRLAALAEERDRAEVEISRRSAEFVAQSQAVTLGVVQAAIPRDAAVVEFATWRPFDPKLSNNEAYGARRYIAYVLRADGEVRWRELGDAGEMELAVHRFREALADPERTDVREAGRALDRRLMEPVRALAGDARRLLISPDGPLNLVPLQALVDEHGRYLVERYSITYLSSGRDLLRMQVARASRSAPLIVADPLFGEPQFPLVAGAASAPPRRSVTTGPDMKALYFAPLAGAEEEARAIQALFPEARILDGREATESALKHVNAPRILHIATHGFFLPADGKRNENPLLRSGLALAGANLQAGGDDDGIFTALEASGLNLWGTKLVTLSACDTGIGEVKNGEGVFGLRRAFVLAGAESLIMSLWPVSDYVTRQTMTALYTGLKQGLGRGEALRQAQLAMLRRSGREHPFYWASFIQSGEWANLDGKR